mmetsp:Transcript_71136/g.179654  ORF Transcript_71136/g.179654 Transcript_71136/m.179654 type:complete len:193 (-) Transcript_71136:71-649(-)
MAADPFKNDEIWKGFIKKEMLTWQSPESIRKNITAPIPVQSRQDAETYYRIPVPGEPVIVQGIERRPELNGARGEVVSGELDQFGRITVRVFDSTMHGKGPGGSRRMKIQPFKLVPSSSAPSFAFAGLPDDRSSVRSLSRAGSVVSGAGRSVLTATARSALSQSHGRLPGAPGSTPFHSSASASEISATRHL